MKYVVSEHGSIELYEMGPEIQELYNTDAWEIDSYFIDVQGEYDSLDDLMSAIQDYLGQFVGQTGRDFVYLWDGVLMAEEYQDEYHQPLRGKEQELYNRGVGEAYLAELRIPVQVMDNSGDLHYMTDDEAKKLGLQFG